MRGIDTNVLARYITQDGEEAPAATAWLEASCTEEKPGFICLVVLCELVWVLRRAYGYDRAAVAAIVERLLTAAEFEVESSTLAWSALAEYRDGPADFSDYLIGQVCREYEAAPVFTLDAGAGQGQNFEMVPGVREKK
jgi:predicted nucleic-acid-binding protein